MALNHNQLSNQLIDELQIPEPARPNFRIMVQRIIEHIQQNAEVNIEDVYMQVDNIALGSESRAVRKFNQRGSIQ